MPNGQLKFDIPMYAKLGVKTLPKGEFFLLNMHSDFPHGLDTVMGNKVAGSPRITIT